MNYRTQSALNVAAKSAATLFNVDKQAAPLIEDLRLIQNLREFHARSRESLQSKSSIQVLPVHLKPAHANPVVDPDTMRASTLHSQKRLSDASSPAADKSELNM